jgi:hypothetical protein
MLVALVRISMVPLVCLGAVAYWVVAARVVERRLDPVGTRTDAGR